MTMPKRKFKKRFTVDEVPEMNLERCLLFLGRDSLKKRFYKHSGLKVQGEPQ